ncbi:MAG: hypothetical protein ABEH58_06545, partial [Haloplanus sp.]
MQTDSELVTAIKADLVGLLAAWRELLFSMESHSHPIRDRWRPETTRHRLAFWAWSGVGAVLILAAYPFAVAGFWARYVTRRLNRIATGLGLIAIVGVVAVTWSALTVLAWGQLPTSGFKAVLTASVVATASTALAWGCTRG